MSSSITTARSRRAFAEVCLALAILITIALVMQMRAANGAAKADHATRDLSRAVLAGSALPRGAPAPPPPPPSLTSPATVKAPGDTDVVVFPPRDGDSAAEAPPIFTMLHGMCGSGENICEATTDLASPRGFLVCPSGNVACGAGWSDWHGDGIEKARFIDGALGAAEQRIGVGLDRARGDVLMGFSRGAFVARDVAYESRGRWVGLVLIGAAMTPDADKLKAAGIRRVVLASGDFDGAKKTMMSARTKLCAAGLPSRFVSLGPIYHALPADLAERLGDSLDWVRDDRDADAACSS